MSDSSFGGEPEGKLRVTVDLAPDEVADFKAYLDQLRGGQRRYARERNASTSALTDRAMSALQIIQSAIDRNYGTGQSKRLVMFLAGVYNARDYPFELDELRSLDHRLSEACLDYLWFDRLGIREVHHYLDGGAQALHRYIQQYEIKATERSG